MRFKRKNVKLNLIDSKNETFRITTNGNTDDLLASIKHVGLLNPPLLIKANSIYMIVCGFRRIAACRRLGLENLEARILDTYTNKLECVRYAIVDNVSQKPLNLVEKSRSIDMLSGFFKNTGNLIKELSALGLSESHSFIKKIKGICHLPISIQKAILSNTLSLSMALELGNLEQMIGESFAKLFEQLKLSLSKQREIFTRIREIALRDDVSMLTVISDNDLREILSNEDYDRNQKTHKIRQYLKQRRFPAVTKSEQRFEKHLKELNLQKDTQLIPPKHYESTTFILNFSFSSIDELKNCQSTLDAIIKNPSLKKILD